MSGPRLAVRPDSVGPMLVSLEQGGLWRADRVPGLCIQVLVGRIWLTEEGAPEDHFLGPGAEHVVRGQGRVVGEADTPGVSVIRIRADRRSAPAPQDSAVAA